MSKKVIGIVLVVILVIAAVLGVVVYNNNKKKEDNKSNMVESTTENKEVKNEENTNDVDDEDEKETSDNKTLVVYFSAQTHTQAVAEQVAKELDADIFEIEPKEKYSEDDLDWTDDESRVSREHDDESLRNVELVTTDVDNWEDYDTVLIGYPIWWGTLNYVRQNGNLA